MWLVSSLQSKSHEGLNQTGPEDGASQGDGIVHQGVGSEWFAAQLSAAC